MAALVLSPNCHASFPSAPIFPQFLKPNFSTLKIKTNQQHTCSIWTSFKALNHCSPIVHGLDKDSNPETVEDSEVNNLGVKAALSVLRFYKSLVGEFAHDGHNCSLVDTKKGEISPILPKSCRYIPTCSEYSMEAYKKYGVVKGTVLTAWRLCRCNPLGGSGYDPPRWFDESKPLEEVDD